MEFYCQNYTKTVAELQQLCDYEYEVRVRFITDLDD